VDAAHALLKADQRPGDVVVDQDVCGLQVDALVAGVGADEDLEVAAGEGVAGVIPDMVVVASGVPAGCEPRVR